MGSSGNCIIQDPACNIPRDALVLDVDTKKFSMSWYPYSSINTTITGLTRNLQVPCRLNYVIDAGAAGAESGTLWIAYDVECIEPIPAADNS